MLPIWNEPYKTNTKNVTPLPPPLLPLRHIFFRWWWDFGGSAHPKNPNHNFFPKRFFLVMDWSENYHRFWPGCASTTTPRTQQQPIIRKIPRLEEKRRFESYWDEAPCDWLLWETIAAIVVGVLEGIELVGVFGIPISWWSWNDWRPNVWKKYD